MITENDLVTELTKFTGLALTEEVKQRIVDDYRNPVKDWNLLNSDNPVKLLFFVRVMADLVRQNSTDQTALALAKLFGALDHSTNLMHAWESIACNAAKEQATTAYTNNVAISPPKRNETNETKSLSTLQNKGSAHDRT